MEGPTDSGSDSTDGSTTGTPEDPWGEEELLTILEGSPIELECHFIEELDGFLHVSNGYSTLRTHWVIDAASGAIVATSPVANHVVATGQFVYAAGDRTGTTADPDEWSVSRMDANGSIEEELFVGPERLWAVAASPTEAFVVRYIDTMAADLWRATDAAPGLEFVVDFGGPGPSALTFVHDGDRLLYQQAQAAPIIALDLGTLAQETLLVPPEPARALFVTSTDLFVGTADGVYRTDKDGQGLELLHAPELAVESIVGDEQMVFWVVAGGQLFAWDPADESLEEISIQAGPDTGYGGLREVAVTPDALYLLHESYVDMTTEHSGSVWRLWRP